VGFDDFVNFGSENFGSGPVEPGSSGFVSSESAKSGAFEGK